MKSKSVSARGSPSRDGPLQDEEGTPKTVVSVRRLSNIFQDLTAQRKASENSKASMTVESKLSRDVGNSDEEKRASSNEEGTTSAEESVKTAEKLFTCAPGICQEPENLIEIAVTLGRHTPSESGTSKRSEDIKCIKINEKRKRDLDVEGSSISCLKTLKTVSEPSWNEKFKILQQQELKEHKKDVERQFMILESEVDIDFSDCASKATESNHKSLLNKSYATNSKDILREVSPEVLVNIRPFKMFTSERYLTAEKVSSCAGQTRNRVQPENEGQLKKKRLSKKVEMSCGAHEHRASPRLSFKRFSVINELDRAEGSVCSLKDASTIPRFWKRKTDSGCCRDCGEEMSEESDGTLRQGDPRLPTLSVLGFCDCESQEEDSKGESNGNWVAEGTGDIPRPKETVDELLDSLDDSNHDIIFQKNISQFRKKIGSPHMDFKKPGVRSRKRKERIVWRENIPEETVRRASDWKDAQTFSDFRFECSEIPRNEERSEKTFSTSSLLPFETKTVARMLGVRTEWGTIRVPQTVEVLYTLGNEAVIIGGSDAVGDSANKVLYSMKAYEAIAALYTLGFCGGPCGTPAKNFPECFRLLHDKTECFYLLPEHLFVEIAQKSGSELNEPNATKMTSRNLLETLGSMAKSEGDGEMELKFVPRKKNVKFTQSWAPHRMIVQMLFCSSSDYAAVICDRMSLPGVPARIRSEPNVPNKNEAKAKTPLSATGVPNQKKKADRETGPERTTEKSVDSDLRIHDFQVIYSNSRESLNDEEEDIAVFSGSKHFLFFPAKRGPGDESSKRCPACSQPRLRESGSRGLRLKSNSSSGEHMTQTEFGPTEQRARRSFNLTREMEKEVECFRKKKSTLGDEEPFRSFLFSKDLKSLLEAECKSLEGRKTAPEKSGTNLRKEVTAAFNTVKEINSCKGEHRGGNGRMSLVIMLSKK